MTLRYSFYFDKGDFLSQRVAVSQDLASRQKSQKYTWVYLIIGRFGLPRCGRYSLPAASTVNGRAKTSKLANKRIKTLLALSAGIAIHYSTEIKNCYQKRVGEGKNKMSTLNIIRNKLLSRAFAVVNGNSNYIGTL
jgi:hypothetical protein